MRVRLGPGPVFAYEWLLSTRRWQLYALRAGFVGSILVGMIVIWHNDAGRNGSGEAVSIQIAAKYAEGFLGLMLAYSAVIASLGLALATWVSRLGRAVALCVAAYVLFSIGWALLTVLLFTPDPVGRFVMMGTPAYGTLLATSLVGPKMFILDDRRAGLSAAVCWTVLYFGLAATLFVATLATFDRCLGRIAKPIIQRTHRDGTR